MDRLIDGDLPADAASKALGSNDLWRTGVMHL